MGTRTAPTNACGSLSSWMYAIDLASKRWTIRLPQCGRVAEEQELQPEIGSLNEPSLNRPVAKKKSTCYDSVLCRTKSVPGDPKPFDIAKYVNLNPKDSEAGRWRESGLRRGFSSCSGSWRIAENVSSLGEELQSSFQWSLMESVG